MRVVQGWMYCLPQESDRVAVPNLREIGILAAGLHHFQRLRRLITKRDGDWVTPVTGGTSKSNLEIAAVWVDDGANAS